MHKFLFAILAALLASASTTANAAAQMKAGLWEMTMKSDAMKNMPKISPEQMEQMRKMGVNMPEMKNGGMVTKVCISKEMAAREEPPAMDKDSGCQSKNFQRSGNSYSVDIVCNGALKGEGRGKGTFSGDESFTSTYDFKGSMHGQPVTQHHESSGKWLSADCGNVKPVDALMKRK